MLKDIKVHGSCGLIQRDKEEESEKEKNVGLSYHVIRYKKMKRL